MRTIIAGSRGLGYAEVCDAMRHAAGCDARPSVVISGTARGVDRAGERWAEENGVPVERYPADWDTHGRAAGVVRNRQMADVADMLVAVWDGKSRGTQNMITEARERGLDVLVCYYRED